MPHPLPLHVHIKRTPCGTRTRNLRIRSPTPCPLGQGGHSAYVNIKDAVQNKAAWHLQGAQRGAADPFRPEVSQQRAQALELWDSRACLAGQVPRPGTPVQELLVFHGAGCANARAPPAGLEPAIFGLEVRRLVH